MNLVGSLSDLQMRLFLSQSDLGHTSKMLKAKLRGEALLLFEGLLEKCATFGTTASLGLVVLALLRVSQSLTHIDCSFVLFLPGIISQVIHAVFLLCQISTHTNSSRVSQ